jgi:hypothetical protein
MTVAGRHDLNNELLRRATDDGASRETARAAGEALAEAYISQGRLYDAPLDEFTDEAYLAFDARVTELQASEKVAADRASRSHEVETA